MRKSICAAGALLLLTGCAVSIKPEAVQLPSAAATQRLPVKVALVLPSGFEQYRYSGRPTSLSGTAFTANMDIGAPTAEALRSRFAEAFTVVPPGPDADVTVEPAIAGVEWRIDDDGQALKQAAIGVFGTMATAPAAITEMRLSLTAYDRNRQVIYQRTVNGRGAGQAGSALSFSMEREVRNSASYALSDASARAVQQLAADPALRALAR